MFKGYYNLTSGMLTQQRNLDVLANNMTNISTTGFKSSRYTATTFEEVMFSRVGNTDKEYTEIGQQSYIRATSEIVTNDKQGVLEQTDIPLDFAIDGEGQYFAVRNEAGETRYTRAGSFTLDEEGYLCYGSYGRVLGADGGELRLMTDKLKCDDHGNIYTEDGGYLGTLGVFSFDENTQLEYNEEGLFTTGAQGQAVELPTVYWRYLERSNVDMVKEMTEMLSVQRTFQSAAQVSKIYDQLMTKATTEIGRL